MANQHELGDAIPGAARGAGSVRHSQRLGRRLGRRHGGLGFKALATSSSACAATLGRLDGEITRAQALAHGRLIASVSPCPVAADLENGFGDSPASGGGDHPPRRRRRDWSEDRSRTQASDSASAHLCPGTRGGARRGRRGGGAAPAVSVHAHGARRELPARQAGSRRHRAAPAGLRTRRRRRAVRARGCRISPRCARCAAPSASRSTSWSACAASPSRVADLAAAGVKRISLSTSLYRAAMTAVLAAAREVSGAGTFSYVDALVSGDELGGYLRAGCRPLRSRPAAYPPAAPRATTAGTAVRGPRLPPAPTRRTRWRSPDRKVLP